MDGLRALPAFVSRGVFDTLQMCNGRFRPSDPVFLDVRRRYLDLLDREGVLAFSDEPGHLDPSQEYRRYPAHYMREVLWSLTGRCNYRCRHCYMSAPHAMLPQPTTEECLRIADQMSEAGVLVVKLTGGECLVRSDFLQIVDRLLAGGVQIETILTNGAPVTEELLCALEERGAVCGFDVSFDEFFDVCCAYLPQFLEDGSPVPRVTFGGIFMVQDGKVSLLLGGVDEGEGCVGKAACETLRDSMYLGSDGAILPCISMADGGSRQACFPNLAGMTLAEALTDSSCWDLVEATVGDVFERSAACRECSYRTRCLGGCRAKGVDEHGNADLMGRDPDSCEFFLGGYYDRARALVDQLG